MRLKTKHFQVSAQFPVMPMTNSPSRHYEPVAPRPILGSKCGRWGFGETQAALSCRLAPDSGDLAAPRAYSTRQLGTTSRGP